MVVFSISALLLSAMGAAANEVNLDASQEIASSATGHGDDVKKVVMTTNTPPEVEAANNENTGEYAGETEVDLVASEQGDEVSKAAQGLAKRRSTQHDEFDSEDKLSEQKGRNPQTGKEIKIPAKKVADDGREPEEKEVEKIISGTGKEKPQRGMVFKIVDKESGEEYFVHATGLIDEIRDEDDLSFEIREGRKGMNAVDVRRTD